MTAKILENEKNTVKMELRIPKDDFQDAMNQAYKKNKKHFTIQGFRKGKAPRKVIEAHYGKGVFLEDAIEIAFPKVYKDALDETKIEAVTRPELKKVDEVNDDGAVFIVEVGVKPEVKLGEYKGAEISPLEADVKDEAVDAKLKEMQNQNARIITEDDAEAKEGDTVVIDYEGFADGEAFEGGKAEGYSLELGSHTFIPGFEEQLIGVKAGDEKEVKVTFPEEYHAEDLKGKEATFKVKVIEVQVKELPALDDEFAKDVSEFDTLDELKKDTAEQLAKEQKRQRKIDAETKAIDRAIETSELDVPDLMVQEEIDQNMENMEKQMQGQGITLDDYLKYTGSTKEDFRNTMKPDAEKNIKAELVLAAIAEAEAIEATDEEMDKEIKQYADAFNHEFEAYKKTLDDRMKEYIGANVKRRKTIDFLVENATQTEAASESAEA
ncbi:MAG: trigger factor [Eubacteriaceae bacterium]|nr:trigger factor [Eubacteriaceae bacterium]MDD4508592.1 trigger factor [Eubacteriaceae bacterium]